MLIKDLKENMQIDIIYNIVKYNFINIIIIIDLLYYN